MKFDIEKPAGRNSAGIFFAKIFRRQKVQQTKNNNNKKAPRYFSNRNRYYTQEELLKIANKLFTDNREYEGTDDIDKNPYAAGRHDGILEMLTKLGIDCEEEPQSY